MASLSSQGEAVARAMQASFIGAAPGLAAQAPGAVRTAAVAAAAAGEAIIAASECRAEVGAAAAPPWRPYPPHRGPWPSAGCQSGRPQVSPGSTYGLLDRCLDRRSALGSCV